MGSSQPTAIFGEPGVAASVSVARHDIAISVSVPHLVRPGAEGAYRLQRMRFSRVDRAVDTRLYGYDDPFVRLLKGVSPCLTRLLP